MGQRIRVGDGLQDLLLGELFYSDTAGLASGTV